MRLMHITMRTVAGVVLLTASLAGAQTTPLFRSAKTYNLTGATVDAIPGALALIDVGSVGGTLDGIPDVLTVQRNQLASILFGNGDGTFNTGFSADLDLLPVAFGAGLFDSDGQPDILVASQDGSIAFFKGLPGEPPFEPLGDAITLPAPEPPGATPTPTTPTPTPTAQAQGFAVAKVDDGDDVDALVAVGSSRGGGLAVLLGDGQGGFIVKPPVWTSPAASTAIATGHFNGDAKLDAAVINPGATSVTILHQDAAGTGVFTVKQTVTLPPGPPPDLNESAPVAIARGELTGDGRDDLVIADNGNDRVLLMRGLADGTFAAPETFSSGTAGSYPFAMTLADVGCFNPCESGKTTDGNLDVVVANYYSSDVSVLTGDAHGHFAAPRQFVADQEPVAVAASDLNNDDAADVVAVSQGTASSTTAAVLPSMSGGLGGVENVITEGTVEAAIGGDVDGDGASDLLVATSPHQVVAYRASPAGGFVPVQVGQLAATVTGVHLERGDFNNDGRLDVVAASGSTATVSVFLAQARNGFANRLDSALQSPAYAVIAGDWDRDGKLDLAVATRPQGDDTGHVEVLLGQGDGRFDPPTAIEVGASPAALDVGDFDKDGTLDLAVANTGSNELSILLGDGVGGFVAGTSIPSINGAVSIAVADFDHDASDDIAIALGQNGLLAYYGNGTGGFTKGPNPAASEVAGAVVARDLTGDGLPDLLVSDQSNSNNLMVLAKRPLGSGQPPDRRFLQRQLVRTSRRNFLVGTADFTGKGSYDAAMTSVFVPDTVGVATNDGGPAVVRGDGNGDGRVTAADALSAIRELNDGRYQRVEQVAGGTYNANGGVDSNGDGILNPLDVVAAANRVFAGA